MSNPALTPTKEAREQTARRAALRHGLVWTLVAIVLLLVFGAYLQPDMAFQLARQLWSCF